MNGKKLTAMGLIVTLSMSAAACAKTEETEEVSKVAVEVQNPEVGELTVDTTYIGTVSPQDQVNVIPKVSGTVTETLFDVGDTVKEGDVLFRIDDEAYQLQLASAQASYEYAEAGVTAQTGGARDLQNYQTEEQIQQLRDSLTDSDDDIEDMEDNLGDLRDAEGKLDTAKRQAQSGVDALNEQQVSQEADLKNLQADLTDLQSEADDADKALKEAQKAAEGLNEGDEGYDAAQAAVEAAEKAAEAAKSAVDAQNEAITNKSNEIDSTKLKISEAQGQVDSLQTQIDGIYSSKTQLKSGIDQLESSQDTIRDNLRTAEESYAITQNEIYPETDATYAAQLQQAGVGIDSAQLQLDYCTVTAPISGVVEAVNVEKNGMAAAGNVAYIISNKESMKVTFNVTEKAKNTLAVGDHVTVERNGQNFDGTITEIGTMAGQQTKLFAVEASVPGAGDQLPNGVSVKVYATTQKAEGKVIIPYDALYFSGGESYVYCVEDNKMVRTDVTVGLMSDTEVVIEEGLTKDSQVVSNWSSKLRDGAEVEVVSVNGEAVSQEETAPADSAETEETQEAEETPEADEAQEAEEAPETDESQETEEASDGEEENTDAEGSESDVTEEAE